MKALLRRRGAAVAAVTSLGLLAALVGITALRFLINQAFSGLGFWEQLLPYTLAFALPVALGVFVSLWLFLPIDGELELRFVVTRALGALLPALVLLFIGQALQYGWLLLQQTGIGSLSVDVVGSILLTGLAQALTGMLVAAPLVVLAAIFQWQWLKHHPLDFDVAGMLDV